MPVGTFESVQTPTARIFIIRKISTITLSVKDFFGFPSSLLSDGILLLWYFYSKVSAHAINLLSLHMAITYCINCLQCTFSVIVSLEFIISPTLSFDLFSVYYMIIYGHPFQTHLIWSTSLYSYLQVLVLHSPQTLYSGITDIQFFLF